MKEKTVGITLSDLEVIKDSLLLGYDAQTEAVIRAEKTHGKNNLKTRREWEWLQQIESSINYVKSLIKE